MADFTPGISPESAEYGIKAVSSLLKELSEAANVERSRRAVNSLQIELKKLAQESKTSTTTTSTLVTAFKQISKRAEDTSGAVKALTNHLAENANMMTTATRAELSDRVAQYRVVASTITSSDKDSQLRRALLSKESRDVNLSLFRDEISKKIEMGKAMVGTNQSVVSNISGIWKSATGRLQLAGRGAAEMAGGLLGVSAGWMAAIAGAAGFVAALYMVIKAMVEAGSKGALNAAKIGVDISDSYAQAFTTGNNYNKMIRDTRGAWVFGSEKMQELIELSNRDYVGSIMAVGDAYSATLSGSVQARNAIRASSIGFVSDMAVLGARFGLTADDSVRLSTRMGVVSRSTKDITERAFFKLSSEALRLGISVESLLGPFSAIAEQAAYTGKQAEYSQAELAGFTSVIEALSSPGMGIPGFMNMSQKGMQEMTDRVVTFAAKIDEFRVAAITAKPGESFSDMLSRVSEMGVGAKVNSVKQLAAQTGMSLSPKSKAEDAFALAKMMGFSGSLKDTLSMGRFMQQAAQSGTLTDASIQSRMAKQIDDRLAASKTVGETVAAGADVNQFIANTIKNMLDVVIGIANTLSGSLFFNESAGKAATLAKADTTPRHMPSTYGTQDYSRPRWH